MLRCASDEFLVLIRKLFGSNGGFHPVHVPDDPSNQFRIGNRIVDSGPQNLEQISRFYVENIR